MKTTTRYRAPTASAYAEVSLDEFSRDEIEAHLAHLRGVDHVPGGEDAGGFEFSGQEMNRIFTLFLCGQREHARDWVCEQIGARLGCKL